MRMIRFGLIFAMALLGVAPSYAQSPPIADDPKVAIETDLGTIVVAVHANAAPVTSSNFLKYVDEKRFDGTSFYRAVGDASYGFVQAGTQNDPKRTLPPIIHEATNRTGLTHDNGALSMARYAPGTAAGDFFVVLGAMPAMDANSDGEGDNQGFAVFAHITAGFDIVQQIVASPKSPTTGEGVMKGQMLDPTIQIISAKRLPLEQSPSK